MANKTAAVKYSNFIYMGLVGRVATVGLVATCPTCKEKLEGETPALVIEHDGVVDAWHLECAATRMLTLHS